MGKTKRRFAAIPADLVRAAIRRKPFGSKNDSGVALVVGGCGDFHGAPVLAMRSASNTLAALRVGAGYAMLYVPQSILAAARALSPDLIVRPLGKRDIGQSSPSDLKAALLRTDSLAIGMGIGRDARALKAASVIISRAASLGKGIVIDADAIYCVRLLKTLGKETILTPQDREFAQLCGSAPPASLPKRIRAAKALARSLSACVLLKGHNTIITDGIRVKVVYSRSATLATMGTGDVLSGIIAGYLAIGNGAFSAAVAGAYLHSRIGDLLMLKKGNHAIASDVVDEIPGMLKGFDRQRARKRAGARK